MAIVYFSYLFDSEALYETMSPLVPELQRENYKPLLDLAENTLESKPELWQVLENWLMGPPDEDEEDDPSPRVALTRICTQFLSPLFEQNFAWQFYREGLFLIGWSKDEIRLLFYGKSLCELLLPDETYDLERFESDPHRRPWCEGQVGWLDTPTIERLHQQLLLDKNAYYALCDNPQSVQERMNVKDDIPMKRYSEGLEKEYSDMVHILETALNANRALAMTKA